MPGDLATLLTHEEEEALRGRSNWMGLWLVAHAWALIFAAMALVVEWPAWWTFLIAFVVISNRQLGLAILMHDAAHRLLFADPGVNDWVGARLCGDPVGANLRVYRPYHLAHHRATQTRDDPDLVLSAPFPIPWASFRRKVLRDLLGITGYQLRRAQFSAATRQAKSPAAKLRALLAREGGFLGTNAILCLALAATGNLWLYPALWLAPLLTGYQLVSRLRNIAEHAVVGEAQDPLRNTRTTYASVLARLSIAPYWVNYHLEHHLFVHTPCWKLPRVHRLLKAKGHVRHMELAGSYLEVFRKACSAAREPQR